MEPFRPAVDETVDALLEFLGKDSGLDKASKAYLLRDFQDKRLSVGKEKRKIFDDLSITAASLAAVYQGKRQKLILPDIDYEEKTKA